MKVLAAQLCPTLYDPMDCSPPVSSVHGILQAGILEWVVISFSRGSCRPRELEPLRLDMSQYPEWDEERRRWTLDDSWFQGLLCDLGQVMLTFLYLNFHTSKWR